LGQLKFADAGQIRQVSVTTAASTCLLSQLLVREDPDVMCLAGLLHNIGELFFAYRYPEQYARVQHGELAASALGMSPWTAGRRLLESWNFPAVYRVAADFSEAPLSPVCPPEHRPAVWLVHAGRRLAHGHLASQPPSEALDTIAPLIRKAYGLDAGLVADLLAALPSRLLDQPGFAWRDHAN
jgi:HD-like signal output (HDOD) protein